MSSIMNGGVCLNKTLGCWPPLKLKPKFHSLKRLFRHTETLLFPNLYKEFFFEFKIDGFIYFKFEKLFLDQSRGNVALYLLYVVKKVILIYFIYLMTKNWLQ